MMVSTVDMTADLAIMKMYPIGRHWVAQFAGGDVSQITPILHYIQDDMDGRSETLAFVTQLFSSAWETRLKQKIQTEVLRPLGYSLEEFRTKGLKELGPDAFARQLYDVQQQFLDIQILVSGFDGDKPHIFFGYLSRKIYLLFPDWFLGDRQW
jgi:hypothetical protein